MKEEQITRFLYSRYGVAIMVLIALVGAWCTIAVDDLNYLTANTGLVFASPNLWIHQKYTSLGINTALCLGIAWLMVMANKWYNMLRSPAILFAGLFLIFEAATPEIFTQMNSSTLIGAIVMICTLILFSCYDNPQSSYNVYLIFMLLSLGSLAMSSLLLYIPFFLIGCAQMRIFNLRSLIAAVFGIVTPAWIVLGLGIVPLESVKMPVLSNIFTSMDLDEALVLLVTVGTTVLLSILAWIFNFMKLLSYNAYTRSMNGFISLMTIATPLLMAVNYLNLVAYVTTLNCFAAYQISHYLTASKNERNYIIVIVILLIYISLYLCRIAL